MNPDEDFPVGWDKESSYHRSVILKALSEGLQFPKYKVGQFVSFSYPHMTGMKRGHGTIKSVDIYPDWNNDAHEWTEWTWAYRLEISDGGMESIQNGFATFLEKELAATSFMLPPNGIPIVSLIPGPGWLFGKLHILEQMALEAFGLQVEVQMELPFYEET